MGILLVAFPNEVGNYFIIVIGVVFLVPSLISLISYAVMKNRDGVKRRFPIESIGSLLFGMWLMITPGFFADLLTYLLGFVLNNPEYTAKAKTMLKQYRKTEMPAHTI